jgi:cytoskeletal protein CcmA (bactofilin family)
MGQSQRRAALFISGEVPMLQPSNSQSNLQKPQYPNPNSYGNMNTVTSPMEQATIGRSLVIKGDVSGAESLYIDGRIEGSIQVADHRVTIGRNGVVQANIIAREVVIMGKVQGNVQCTERVDIRSEGSLTGDVITQRVSVEDGAILKGSVEVRVAEKKAKPEVKAEIKSEVKVEAPKPALQAAAAPEGPKALAATAGAGQ